MQLAESKTEFHEKLRSIADEVAEYWGVSIPVKVKGSSPSFCWDEILIPESMSDSSESRLRTTLLHEWGHRCLAPVTVENGLWWEIIAKTEGIDASHEVINIATDMIVDSWYIHNGRKWSGIYRAEHKEMVMNVATRAESIGLDSYITELLIPAYACVGGWENELDNKGDGYETAVTAVRLLLDPNMSLHRRIRMFCREVAPYFRNGKMESQADTLSRKGNGAGNQIWGDPSPWRGKKWDADELVKLVISCGDSVNPKVVESVCGDKAAGLIQSRLRVLEALVSVESSIERLESRIKTDRHEGTTLWRTGESVKELQALNSLERYGMLLPGMTTLRNNYIKEPDKPSITSVCLIVDNSGSTSGAILDNELQAAVGLIEASRRLDADVSLLVFGSEVDIAIEPCTEYDRLEMTLAGLNGQSGGTFLTPAVRTALHYSTNSKDKMATVIFTDSYIFDETEAAGQIGKLTEKGPVVVFCVENSLDQSFIEALDQLQTPPRIIKHNPEMNLVDEALEIF